MHAQSICHVRNFVFRVCCFAYLGHGAFVLNVVVCGNIEASFGEVALEYLHDAVCVGVTMQRQHPDRMWSRICR